MLDACVARGIGDELVEEVEPESVVLFPKGRQHLQAELDIEGTLPVFFVAAARSIHQAWLVVEALFGLVEDDVFDDVERFAVEFALEMGAVQILPERVVAHEVRGEVDDVGMIPRDDVVVEARRCNGRWNGRAA